MCHFAFKTQVKEMISPSDVSKMFTLDFINGKLMKNLCLLKTEDS